MAGVLFVPDDLSAGQTRPGIVMCHGFTAVKEVMLPRLPGAWSAWASGADL